MVVERQLMERQEPGRREMGPRQIPRAGLAVEGPRAAASSSISSSASARPATGRSERFTMDEGLSRAVIKVFVELHREGLIYKDKRLVNWDPRN